MVDALKLGSPGPKVEDEAFSKNVRATQETVLDAAGNLREHDVQALNFRGEDWTVRASSDKKITAAEAQLLITALRKDNDMDYETLYEAISKISVSKTGDASHLTAKERDLMLDALKKEAPKFEESRGPASR